MSSYKKSEIVASGQWPEEFLKDLVSEVPPVTIASSAVLTWHCPVHGDYQQAVSVHLRSCSCPRCNRGNKLSQRQRLANPFSEQFLNDLTPEFRLRADQGLLRQSDQADFQCPTHGVYRQLVKSHLRGGACPKCRSDKYAEFLSKNHANLTKARTEKHRKDRPYPDWFINDLEGSPDKDAVLSLQLKGHDKAQFSCSKHGWYYQLIYDHLAGKGCPQCVQGTYRSKREIAIQQWLEYLGLKVEHNVRILQDGDSRYEVDTFLPDLVVGFEFNGLFYHHSGPGGKPRDYHQHKTQLALESGIRLYHFWEYVNEDLVKSIIVSKLGLADKRIQARKCSVDTTRRTKVLNDWHIDGDAPSKWQFSLVYQSQIVATMTIRFTDGVPEIARYACKPFCVVVGGFQKLLKHVTTFLKQRGYNQLLSYCNRDLSPDPTQTIYAKNGFEYLGECSPILSYFSLDASFPGYARTVIPRQACQKHKLLAMLGIESSAKTEQELLYENWKVVPVYNSGNFKYILCF